MNKIEKLTQAITDFFAEKGQHYGYDDETIKEMKRFPSAPLLRVVRCPTFCATGVLICCPIRRSASTPTRTLLQSVIVWSRNTGWNCG